MERKIIKFDDTEIEKYNFHQNKSPISINNIDIDKIVVTNKLQVLILNTSLVAKILKKLEFYAYSVHKRLYIK